MTIKTQPGVLYQTVVIQAAKNHFQASAEFQLYTHHHIIMSILCFRNMSVQFPYNPHNIKKLEVSFQQLKQKFQQFSCELESFGISSLLRQPIWTIRTPKWCLRSDLFPLTIQVIPNHQTMAHGKVGRMLSCLYDSFLGRCLNVRW